MYCFEEANHSYTYTTRNECINKHIFKNFEEIQALKCVTYILCLSLFFPLPLSLPPQVDLILTFELSKMAFSFTRMMSCRNTATLLASLGAGTMATCYLMTDSNILSAEERRKLYPPR